MICRDYLPDWPAPPPRRFGRDIIADVAREHGLTVSDLCGPARSRHITHPRQEAMLRMREQTILSTTQIGRMLGGRDHTTVLWALKRARERRAANG